MRGQFVLIAALALATLWSGVLCDGQAVGKSGDGDAKGRTFGFGGGLFGGGPGYGYGGFPGGFPPFGGFNHGYRPHHHHHHGYGYPIGFGGYPHYPFYGGGGHYGGFFG